MASDAELEARLVAIRRELHRHPELSREERETTRRLQGWLEAAGILPNARYGLRTGLIAEIGGPGPVVALRADIDALPIQEETGLTFASLTPGVMHACGHDFHAAALVGAALLLQRRAGELPGTVRLLFQPAEEKAAGARELIAAGALDGAKAVFGLHNKPDLPVGAAGIKAGPLLAAADGFVVELRGRATHAAVPEAGLDPIAAAAHVVTALQTIASRSVGPLDSAVVSVTKLHSGTSWNIIPDLAVLEGTIRTFDEAVRRRVLERFEAIVVGVASALGSEATLRWVQGPPPVLNDPALAELGREAAAAAGLEAIEAVPSLAGEDFAYYQREVPGLFVFLGTNGPQEWHHPRFDVDERALLPAARLLAELAERALRRFAAEAEETGAEADEDGKQRHEGGEAHGSDRSASLSPDA
ncbi:amidohydrolase [Paenibacillus albicereus]|uniref:Amidohydrolase n=1 Tax=Paenibacillus albicereus TaxID=2726185 RepID=A0A6H2H468_9BACL|nr:amidohydrolase [Paenibacillus albicereus]QJC54138.1 amidohydrolase [Paenibacillus albicereus]